MTLREFNHVIKEVSNFVFNVALGGNGELTLIPKIDNYIASGYKNKLYVSADTNLNCSSGVVKRMFKAGIASVNISLDGTSQDSYGKYRIGGKFETVFNNMVLLASMKKKANSTLPYIQWQFIVNKYNEDEVEKAKVIAKETGVELRTSLPFIPGGDNYFFGDNPAVVKIIAKKFIPNNHRYRIMRRTDLLACYQPFSELQILSNGDIIPCCRLREKNVVMGNIFKQSLGEIWNNDLFRYFRKQLVKQGKRPHCLKCYHNMKEYYKKYNKNKYESYP
jgi:radical SAM protein with 4Fe4S-binding SPASM domain